MITVLLVDDEPRVRRGLRMRLQLEADLEVVGEAGDGAAAIALAERLRPQVVLMDVEMPGMDGIRATESLRGVCPCCQVVMLSLHDDQVTRARARLAGAFGFVSKSDQAGELTAAIRGAARRDVD